MNVIYDVCQIIDHSDDVINDLPKAVPNLDGCEMFEENNRSSNPFSWGDCLNAAACWVCKHRRGTLQIVGGIGAAMSGAGTAGQVVGDGVESTMIGGSARNGTGVSPTLSC